MLICSTSAQQKNQYKWPSIECEAGKRRLNVIYCAANNKGKMGKLYGSEFNNESGTE